MGGPGDGDAALLHGFQQRRLGARRGAVDLIRQDQVGKHRAALEAETAPPFRRLGNDHRAGDVGGHQIRGELDAAEGTIDRFGKRAHQDGLAQARHAFQKGVAARQQGDQQVVHQLALPDDDLLQLGQDGFGGGLELFGGDGRWIGFAHD